MFREDKEFRLASKILEDIRDYTIPKNPFVFDNDIAFEDSGIAENKDEGSLCVKEVCDLLNKKEVENSLLKFIFKQIVVSLQWDRHEGSSVNLSVPTLYKDILTEIMVEEMESEKQ